MIPFIAGFICFYLPICIGLYASFAFGSAIYAVLGYAGSVVVAHFYKLDEEVLIGRVRTKDVAFARQMAMYLAREETDASLPQIGEALGGRDHTTVMHGWEKIASRIEQDDQLRREMLAIREELYSGGRTY